MEEAHPFTYLDGGEEPQVKEDELHTSLRRGEDLEMGENHSPYVLSGEDGTLKLRKIPPSLI